MHRIRSFDRTGTGDLERPLYLKSDGARSRSARNGTIQSEDAKCRSLDSPDLFLFLNFSEYVQTCLFHIWRSTHRFLANFASIDSEKCVVSNYSIKNKYSNSFK
jgi:hypothetical protein